jgi:hypothetical protein
MKRTYSVNDVHVVLNDIFLTRGMVSDKWNALLMCVKDNKTHTMFVMYIQNRLRNVNDVELCLDVVDFVINYSFNYKLITRISSNEIMEYVVAIAKAKCGYKTYKYKIAYLINKWIRIFNLNKSHPAFKGFFNAYIQLKYVVDIHFPNRSEHKYIPTYKRAQFPVRS